MSQPAMPNQDPTDVPVRIDVHDKRMLLKLLGLTDPVAAKQISSRLVHPGVWAALRAMLADLTGTEPISIRKLAYLLASPTDLKIIKSESHIKNLKTLICALCPDMSPIRPDEDFLPAAMKYLDSLPNSRWGQFDTNTSTKILIYVCTDTIT